MKKISFYLPTFLLTLLMTPCFSAQQENLICQMDQALGLYYNYRFRGDDYFNASGKGKFLEYCEENGIEDKDLLDEIAECDADINKLDDCMLLDFDPHVPYPTAIKDEKKAKLFQLISTISKFFDPNSKAISIKIHLGLSAEMTPISLSVREECTIWYIKQKVRQLASQPLPYYVQKILCFGKKLNNEKTLKYYNVKEGCVLHYLNVRYPSTDPTLNYNMFMDKKNREEFIVQGYIREEALKLKKEVPADIIKQITRLLPMMFYVKNADDNSTITVDCVGTDTIQEVQKKISQKTNHTSENRILAYEGEFIDNENSTITETKMVSFSTIFLMGLFGKHRDGF